MIRLTRFRPVVSLPLVRAAGGLAALTGRLKRFRPLVSLPLVGAAGVFAAQVVSGHEMRADASAESGPAAVHAELVNLPTLTPEGARRLDVDSLIGRSGNLRVRILEANETRFYPSLEAHFGAVVRRPGIRALPRTDSGFAFITMAPWSAKTGSRIRTYQVGYWPGELGRMTAQYANPAGFIEVTPENVDTRISTHFRLRDFVTHDQQSVWPKYVVLREDLLDKLELVLDALQSFGVATHHVVVLSGFRSPQYNARGAGEGMARASRHQYGDAADIIIDANRDGRMDDLNLDGRVTFADVQVLDRAVQLIEQKFPELVGGLGLYHEMGPSGPFAHIDVRGTRARWTNARRPAPAAAGWRQAGGEAAIPATRCLAEGAMAVLCGRVR
jgi:hypothetical protein